MEWCGLRGLKKGTCMFLCFLPLLLPYSIICLIDTAGPWERGEPNMEFSLIVSVKIFSTFSYFFSIALLGRIQIFDMTTNHASFTREDFDNKHLESSCVPGWKYSTFLITFDKLQIFKVLKYLSPFYQQPFPEINLGEGDWGKIEEDNTILSLE